jgi:hypothetical protein
LNDDLRASARGSAAACRLHDNVRPAGETDGVPETQDERGVGVFTAVIQMGLETAYHGFSIVYDEETDLWRCAELSLESASLSMLRKRIDSFEAGRRDVNFRAFLMHPSRLSVMPVIVLQLDPEGSRAWITQPGGEAGSRHSEAVDLNRLILDTPKNREALLAWREAARLWHEASISVTRMGDALPRLDTDRQREAANDH